MVKMKYQKESELTNQIINYYESLNFISYKEVSLYGRGGDIRCDTYLIKDDLSIVIETKLNLTIKVIEQAYNWKNHANKVFICVPFKNKINFALNLCKLLNIGLIMCSKNNIYIKYEPIINNNIKMPILYNEQKNTIGGNCNSDFYTSFKNTIKNIDIFMSNKDEYLLKDMISEIKHHYVNDKSAINSIKKMIKNNVIKNYHINDKKIIKNVL